MFATAHNLHRLVKAITIFSLIAFASCKTNLDPLETTDVPLSTPNDSSIVYISYQNKTLTQQMFVTTDYINSDLAQGYGLVGWPAWSPNKQLIAYIFGGAQLWMMRFDGTRAHPLVISQTYLTSPRWSHDGKRLAFVGVLQGRQGVFLADSSGGNLRCVADTALSPNWSLMGFPYVDWCDGDSSLLIGYSQLDSPYVSLSVGILNLINLRLSKISSLDWLEPSQPRPSPRRDEIVFIGEDNFGSNGKLYRANLDGSGVTKLCNAWECLEPSWSRDGERIMFLKRDGEASALSIWVVNRDGMGLREIFGIEGFHVLEPDW